MKNKKNRPSQKSTQKPMPRTDAPKSLSPKSLTSKSSEPASKAAAVDPLLSIDAQSDSAEPLLAEVQSFLAKRTELAKRLKEEIAATEAKLEQLRKTAASLMPERAPATLKEKKPKKARPAAATGETTPTESDAGNEGDQTGLPD